MKNKERRLLLVLILIVFLSLSLFLYFSKKGNFGDDSVMTVTDKDGNIYNTVEIGEQIWLAENLKSSSHSEGESWCYLEREENCEKLGRLYNGQAAMVVCPEGWSLPSNDDWNKLVEYMDEDEKLGAHLKAKDVWNMESKEGDVVLEAFDTYSFNGLPGGHSFENNFYEIGKGAYWWSSTAETHGAMWVVNLYEDSNDFIQGTFSPDHGFSVRCIKN